MQLLNAYAKPLLLYGLEAVNPNERTLTRTSLPKVIWEQGRVAAAVPGAGWHKA